MLSARMSDGTLGASGTSGLLGVTEGWIEPLEEGQPPQLTFPGSFLSGLEARKQEGAWEDGGGWRWERVSYR